MVRHKTRWMLVRLDGLPMNSPNKEIFKKDLASAIRENIVTTWGLAGEGAALETQVRLWDPWTSLLLIRVPRNDYSQIRASLTVWTHLGSRRIVASVLGVYGSARTAKRGTMLYIQKWFLGQQKLLLPKKEVGSTKALVPGQELQRLQSLLSTIQGID